MNLRRYEDRQCLQRRDRQLCAWRREAGHGPHRRPRRVSNQRAMPANSRDIGKQVAMHVAASAPKATTRDDVDPADIQREREVLTAQAKESGRPDNIIEKMVEGRLRKFYEESVLTEQAFVIDPDKTVGAAVEEVAKEIGAPITVKGFVRMAIGEGVEKEESDFAAEVAAAAKG